MMLCLVAELWLGMNGGRTEGKSDKGGAQLNKYNVARDSWY